MRGAETLETKKGGSLFLRGPPPLGPPSCDTPAQHQRAADSFASMSFPRVLESLAGSGAKEGASLWK